MTAADWQRHPSSFRDPKGFVAERAGQLLRLVEPQADDDLTLLQTSGLYAQLVERGWMVSHDDLGVGACATFPRMRALAPERIPVVSYASEWTASQLKAAALLTLSIHACALEFGMALKDASAFNIQFVGARPVLIDTLSLTQGDPDAPWTAYRQFCEHFLGPLALQTHRPELAWALTHAQTDGLPVPVASRSLPGSTWFDVGLFLHLHAHARAHRRDTGSIQHHTQRRSAGFQMALCRSLRRAVTRIQPKTGVAAPLKWASYRATSTYPATDAAAKLDFVVRSAGAVGARRALDLGANDGLHSFALAKVGIACTAVELDAECCEFIYRSSDQPLPAPVNTMRVDLANPTPGHGWAGQERAPFSQRLHCDLVLALALVHHLAISRHVPYARIAAYFAQLAPHLLVEYTPPEDPMAQRLLDDRTGPKDALLSDLGRPAFEAAFGAHYDTLSRSTPLAGQRVVYLMRRKTGKA